MTYALQNLILTSVMTVNIFMSEFKLTFPENFGKVTYINNMTVWLENG